MGIHLRIQFPHEMDGEGIHPYLENYGALRKIMERFMENCESLEVHCWEDETDAIRELAAVSDQVDVDGGNPTIIRTKCTREVKDLILNRGLNEKNQYKWFTVFFKRGGEIYFSAEHWGSSAYIPNVGEEDIKFIRAAAGKDADIFQYRDEDVDRAGEVLD
jgi:hypothetical protein